MAQTKSIDHAHTWSSGTIFILAAVGATVGLGNIWKFPYVVGVSGGGAFILIYIACVLFVAIPILIGELLIGRMGHHSPPVAMAAVAKAAGRSRAWTGVGWLGTVVGYLIATYYSVIAGWTLAYLFKALDDFGGAQPQAVAAQFDELFASPGTMILWHTLFTVASMFVLAQGLRRGIERAAKLLMPGLFGILVIMIGYAAFAGDFEAALRFLFTVDFSGITAEVVISAVGQAFFSISVAMGLMMAYGAYLPSHVSLTRSAFIIAGGDTLVALLAGLMIFPIVFANGLDPAAGPGLIFVTLPAAFVAMPAGAIFGALFFLLLAAAAFTSMIALVEPIIAYAEDRWRMRRGVACLVFGSLAWLLGLASLFSFNLWSDFYPLAAVNRFSEATIFDLLDYLTANLLLPLGGIFIAVFLGWRVKPTVLAEELSFGRPALFKVWLWTIRVVVPLAIIGVFYSGL